MNIDTFLIECLMRGIRISLAGDSLKVQGELKPATADFIRKNKEAIIAALSDQQHGDCYRCETDTDAMLTVPGEPWCWCCMECFERRKAHGGISKKSRAVTLFYRPKIPQPLPKSVSPSSNQAIGRIWR